MVFRFSALNRVYNFMGVCLKQGLKLSLTARVWSVQLSSLNMAYRVLILAILGGDICWFLKHFKITYCQGGVYCHLT